MSHYSTDDGGRPESTFHNRRLKPLLLSSCVGVSLVASSAFAQSAAPPAQAAAPPVQANAPAKTGGSVDEIVVTAQRRSQNIQDVPIAVHAYSGKNLVDQGVHSTADLGMITPNVAIALPAGAGGPPLITIRGIGLNDFGAVNAGPNGVYLDEVYLSLPASQTFQTFDLSRVEILEGPQGTLYGKNTTGGAVNVVSNKPTDTPSADLHLAYSSYNTINVEGNVNGPITPTLDGRISFVENHSDGYIHDVTLNENNYQQSYGVRAALLWTPTSDLKILFNVHGGQVDNPYPGYQHLGDFVPGTQGFNPTVCSVQQTNAHQCVDLFGYGYAGSFYADATSQRNFLRVDSLGGYVRAEYALGSINLVSLTAVEHLWKSDAEDLADTPLQLLDSTVVTNANTVSQEFRASQSTARYNWVVGAYYSHEEINLDNPIVFLPDADKVFGPGGGDGLTSNQLEFARQTTDSGALFGQGEYFVTDKLKLILGGRITADRKRFDYDGSIQFQEGGEPNFGPLQPLADVSRGLNDSAFTWRAGTEYRFTPGAMAYGTISTGFKGGVFNDGYLSSTPDQVLRQLDPVKPETVTTYEVGFKTSFFDHRLVANASAFYNDYANQQVFVLVPPAPGASGGPVNVLDNAKQTHTDGLDLLLSVIPVDGLTFTAKVGLLDSRVDKFVAVVDPSQPSFVGNQQPFAPHVTSDLMVEYRLPIGENVLDAQLSASYRSHQFYDISNDPYIAQPGYWISNLRVGYTFSNGRYEVAGFIRNMGNQEYDIDRFDLTGPFGYIQGIPGQPRMFGLELNLHY